MPAQTSNGHIRKYLRTRKLKKASVLRVLAAVMENQAAAGASNQNEGDESNSDYHNEFFTTGRIGRRNALPDILGYTCTTTTADLPLRLSTLTTNDTPSTSTVSNATGSTTGEGSSSTSTNTTTSPSCSSSTQPIAEAMNTT